MQNIYFVFFTLTKHLALSTTLPTLTSTVASCHVFNAIVIIVSITFFVNPDTTSTTVYSSPSLRISHLRTHKTPSPMIICMLSIAHGSFLNFRTIAILTFISFVGLPCRWFNSSLTRRFPDRRIRQIHDCQWLLSGITQK